MEFDSYNAEAVHLAAELADYWPEDSNDAELRAWLARYRPARVAEEADLTAVRALGKRLWHVFAAAGDPSEVSRRINELLDDAQVRPQLSSHGGRTPHLHYAPADASVERWLAATAAMALAGLVSAEGTERLGVCVAGDCESPYVDMSRNRSRRFCCEGCATRAKVAAYRARKRQQA